jgi:hypothetical protein
MKYELLQIAIFAAGLIITFAFYKFYDIDTKDVRGAYES